MKELLVFSALGIFMACGCAGPVAPREPTTSDSSPVAPAPERTPSDAGAPASAVQGLTLDRAIEMAERSHPALASARARVEAAGGRALQAGIYPNPRGVARIESAPFEGRTTGEAEYVGGVSMPVIIPGRLSTARRVEELERDRLREEAETKRIEVLARVRGTFATGLYSERIVQVQEEATGMSESGVAIAKTLLSAGEALPEDVARAEMERFRAGLDLERARSLREVALVDLAAAMGDPGLTIESLAGDLDAALAIPTLESLSARLASHPSLRSARAAVVSQEARVDLAEVQRIPEVNLDLFYRRLEHSREDSFDAGISVAIPVFDRNQGRLREARAEVEAAEADARAVRNALTLELRELHAQLVRALGAAKVLREEVGPRAETILKAAEARYTSGDIRLTEVLIARRDRTTVRLTYLQSLREVMEAWARLSPFMPRDKA